MQTQQEGITWPQAEGEQSTHPNVTHHRGADSICTQTDNSPQLAPPTLVDCKTLKDPIHFKSELRPVLSQ